MDSKPRNIDLWMQETLNSWAEQGTLQLEKSTQLQKSIAKLAHQERRKRFTRKVSALAAAILTFIWFLFASCPVAAASYAGNSIHSTQPFQVTVICPLAFLTCFLVKRQFQSLTTNINFEVYYE